MYKLLFVLVGIIEVFALYNRGGGPFLSHLVLTGITFLALCLCVFGRLRVWKNSDSEFKFGAIEGAYVAFLAVFVLSLFFSLTPSYGLSELLLFLNAGILSVIFASIKWNENDLKIFASVIVFIAACDTLIGYFIYTQTPFPRFAGTFIDLKEPYTSFGNDYANFLLLVLPLAAWLFLKKHERRMTTVLTGLLFAILLSGFALSFSRGAWISLFAVIVIAVVWWIVRRCHCEPQRSNLAASSTQLDCFGLAGPRNDKALTMTRGFALRIVAVLILTVLLIGGLQSSRSREFKTTFFIDKILFRADEGTASASERMQFWRGAVALIGDRPLLGGGVLSFKYLYPKYQPTFGANWDHPHNVLLKIGVENGVFAMVFFGLFIAFVVVGAFKFLWRAPSHPVIFFLLGAAGSFGHNLIDFNFIVANYTLFMVFIGMAVSFFPARRVLTGGVFTILIVALSFCALSLGVHDAYYNIDFKTGRAALVSGDLDVAVGRLERAKNAFFARDLTHYLSLAYAKKYEQTKDAIWREKEISLLEKEIKNDVDAVAFSRLGELLEEKKLLSDADKLYAKAISADPENELHYYYDLVALKQARGEKIDPKLREKIISLLGEYSLALHENRHITVITDNPQYAEKLYEFLDMKKELQEFDKIWLEEVMKFGLQYGMLAK